MKLAEVIRPDRVIVPLEVGTLREAASALHERLQATGAIANPERLSQRINEMRGEDIVAMGERAFLVHVRTDAVHEISIAMGVAPHEIVREVLA